MRPRLAAALAALALALGPAPARAQGEGVDLQRRLGDVRVTRTEGGYRVEIDGVVTDGPGFVDRLYESEEEQRHKGILYALLNITTPWGFLWVTLGFAGQALFTLRMVLQWIASEKERRSIVPVGFWWGSLFGGLMLFAYFAWRKDIVGIVGQSTGVFVYARNLALIYRRGPPTSASSSVPHPAP